MSIGNENQATAPADLTKCNHTGPHGTQFHFSPDLSDGMGIWPPGATKPIMVPAEDVLDLLFHRVVGKRIVGWLERLELRATFEIGPPEPGRSGDSA